MLSTLSSVEQFTEATRANSKLLVWFSASWCGPCQQMNKTELLQTAGEKGIPIAYTDQTEVPELTELCNIRQFPTFILFVDGVESARRVSSETAKVCMWIRKLLA
jgi:thiol-disulfide isomerase/thioredoxin